MSLSIKYALSTLCLTAASVAGLLTILTPHAFACEKGKVCDASNVPNPVLSTPVVNNAKPNVPGTVGGNGSVVAPSASQTQQSAATYNNQGGNSSSNAQVIQFGGPNSATASTVNGGGVSGTIGCAAPFPTLNVGVTNSSSSSSSDNPGFDGMSGNSNSNSVFVQGTIPLGLANARQEQCQRVIDQQIATNARLDQFNTLNECRKAALYARDNGIVFDRNIVPGVTCPDFKFVVVAPPAPATPVVAAPEAPRTPEVPLPRAPRTPEVSLPSTRN